MSVVTETPPIGNRKAYKDPRAFDSSLLLLCFFFLLFSFFQVFFSVFLIFLFCLFASIIEMAVTGLQQILS